MAKSELIASVDQALAALKVARKAIVANAKLQAGSKTITTSKKAAGKQAAVKRGMSEEGRQRIAEAQRKRWAVLKRAAKKAARSATANN